MLKLIETLTELNNCYDSDNDVNKNSVNNILNETIQNLKIF